MTSLYEAADCPQAQLPCPQHADERKGKVQILDDNRSRVLAERSHQLRFKKYPASIRAHVWHARRRAPLACVYGCRRISAHRSFIELPTKLSVRARRYA